MHHGMSLRLVSGQRVMQRRTFCRAARDSMGNNLRASQDDSMSGLDKFGLRCISPRSASKESFEQRVVFSVVAVYAIPQCIAR
jgi:hypothetical protein